MATKTKIIAIINHKGGVAKTTTAVNLAHGMAIKGKKVLIIDLDPQGSAAETLGMEPAPGAYYLLIRKGEGSTDVRLVREQVVSTRRRNLWLLPGDSSTSEAQLLITNRDIGHIRWALRPFMDDGLDCIILDTNPSEGGVQERAGWAADLVIIPTQLEFKSLKGVQKTIRMLNKLRNEWGWKGGLAGVLPTFFETHTIARRTAYEDLERKFKPAKLLLPPVRDRVVIPEASAAGETVFEYDGRSDAAKDYMTITERVMRFF